ncbi:MAG: 50S ribosomal protein L37ae [Candidatus Woesearchaeota archaeon]
MGKKTGSAGRFGVRYGKTIRTKILQVEKKQRKKQVCPYCKKPKVKRLAMGIFKCGKCDSKFTGKAYYV